MIVNKTEQEFVLQALKFARTVLFVSNILYLSAGMSYVIVAVGTTYNQEKRVLILDSTYPFETDTSPTFEILFIIQAMSIFFGCAGHAFEDSLFIILVRKRF